MQAVSPRSVPVVISTCDGYSDAWPPFFTLLFRYWPDCPFPVVLLSETQSYPHPRVRSIAVGEDRGWASNLKYALDELGCQSFLYLQEDYFLQRPVDTPRLWRVIEHAHREQWGYVRLAGVPEPQRDHPNSFGLGELARGQKFRCSLQAAWWNVSVLRQILVDGETGWEMEINGSPRSAGVERPFLAAHRHSPLIDYYFHTAIRKGKWMPGALRLCRREGIPVDTSRRPIQPEWPILWKEIRRSPAVAALRRWLGTKKD